MKFYLVNGEVKFLTHKVEWQEREENKEMSFYDINKKDNFISHLSKRETTPTLTITEYKQPTQDIIDKVNGKKFETIEEAQAFIDGTTEPTELETIALAVAELFELVGGANNG